MLPIHRTLHSVFNYDEIPAGYYFQVMTEGKAVQKFWHREKFQEITSRIPADSKVLDLGCGPGSFLWTLAQQIPSVRATGVDIASSQIKFAIDNVQSKFTDGRVEFKILDPNEPKLPFADGSFDVITSIEVIEHIHPHLAYKLLEEAKRVLRPNGKMIVTTPNYRSLWPLIEILLEKLSPVKYHDQHISKFTPNSAVKFLETLGMEVQKVSSLFCIAPFLSPLSEKLGLAVLGLEKKLDWHVGSLLVLEAKNTPWNEKTS